ncbi:G-protein coupled receptor [Scedosporium apiospermum]|uniref:G-protein coupled receptor n=1 Tax=Pseudallescheria apiosperma TaxID=563466 RepID=A0A084G7E3_PSEDA|nr:G-protein coupled receptor [Scedosporium apiospermum]KEZ43255.1 G-protein coupled receptor [Scedosporium apiospermum]
MPADSLWTLSMAINVYLTFYRRFDAPKLRKLELPYLLFNYGVPFVPAFVFIWVKDREGNRVYGNATLWCWITWEWKIWRIIAFYGPVWVVIITTMFIYFKASGTLYKNRKRLHAFRVSEIETDSLSRRITEVSTTTEVNEGSYGVRPAARALVRYRSDGVGDAGGRAAYPATISAGEEEWRHTNRAEAGNSASIRPSPAIRRIERRIIGYEINKAAWSYAKYAILFYAAMFVTWIPSTTNRLYSLLNENRVLLPLEYLAGFVLTLQGFWNCIIYMKTSWLGCKTLFRELCIAVQSRIAGILAPLKRDIT